MFVKTVRWNHPGKVFVAGLVTQLVAGRIERKRGYLEYTKVRRYHDRSATRRQSHDPLAILPFGRRFAVVQYVAGTPAVRSKGIAHHKDGHLHSHHVVMTVVHGHISDGYIG